jgi:hypothetical protein
MLVLRKEAAAVMVPLGGGARLTVRPATDAVYTAAQIAATRTLEAIRAGEAAMAEAGLDAVALTSDEDLAEGLRQSLFAVEIGVRCVVGWDGIGDEEGRPVGPSRESLLMLLRDPAISRKLLAAACAPIHARRDEGNASAASPNGAGGAADATAGTAGRKGRRARAAAAVPAASVARSTSTRRGRGKGASLSTSRGGQASGGTPA